MWRERVLYRCVSLAVANGYKMVSRLLPEIHGYSICAWQIEVWRSEEQCAFSECCSRVFSGDNKTEYVTLIYVEIVMKEERLELCVIGEEVIEGMRRQMDEEGLDEDYLESPEQSALDELSDMLTKAFQAWADKHGYDKSVAYGTNAERYDLKTGRLVLE